jgi:hypothetical protein
MFYDFDVEVAGKYRLWMRANPIQAKLSIKLNEEKKRGISLKAPKDNTNIASDGKPDLRFLAVSEGKLAANVILSLEDAFALKGAKLSQKQNLDALREADVKGDETSSGGIDPLIHFVGRTNLSIGQAGAKKGLADLSKHIDRKNQIVTSNSGELMLDYGKGLLKIDAPGAQGVSGNLKTAGKIALSSLTVESNLELAQIVAVTLDGKPLAQASKILLQVMTEEKPTGFTFDEIGNGLKKITNLGNDPWLFKEPEGIVWMKFPDAATMKVTALDLNGYPVKEMGSAEEIRLDPKTVYYLLKR